MKQGKTSRQRWQAAAGLAALLLLSHGAAAIVAIELARAGQVAAALTAALATGMALTLALQRTFWLTRAALSDLNAGRLPDGIPARWCWPLGSLVAQVNLLIARQREVRELRQNLLRQAGESAAQQERNRLARDLHDSIKQQIFSISMGAAAVQARWDTDPQGAREALSDVRRSAQEAMVEMNALLQQLSPTPLERVGLSQALRDQCEAFSYRTGADVQITFGDLPADDRLSPGAQESVFRIAQEALSNAARHARAEQVHLSLGLHEPDGPLVLEIQDDGLGFEPGTVQSGMGPHRGMGLGNIRQRVLALGGEVEIDSAPGKGTLLRASVPLAEPQGSDAARADAEPADAYRPDHTLNRIFLLGIGGGLVLIAVLFYPLYLLVPGGLVAGWPAGSSAIGLALQIAAALLPVALGTLAARWAGAGTRQEGTLWGALAGGVAGSILYLGLVGAAAGVVGSGALLEHGLALTARGGEALYLLSEAVNGTIWAAYGMFWIALLAGTGLGALGGLIAPPKGTMPDRSNLRPAVMHVLAAAALLSALSLGTVLFLFPQIEPAFRNLLAGYVGAPANTLPLAGLSLWPAATQALLYLGSLLALYLLLRREASVEDPARVAAVQTRAAELGLLALGMPVVIWFLGWEILVLSPLLRALFALAAAGSLIMASLYTFLFVETRRWRQVPGFDRASIIRTAAFVATALSLAALAWAVALPSLLSLLVALGIIAASAALIAILWRQPELSRPTRAGWARLQLSMSQSIGAGLGAIVAMVIPMMVLISVTLSALTILLPWPRMLVNAAAGGQLAAPEHTLVDLVQNAYLAHASALVFSLVGAGAILGLLMLVISGRMALGRRRWPPPGGSS